MQETGSKKFKRFIRIYLTIHISIQQEKIQEITRKTGIGPQNQSNTRHTK